MASSLAEVRDQLVGGAEESQVMASYGWFVFVGLSFVVLFVT
jgi:hypothetical protein